MSVSAMMPSVTHMALSEWINGRYWKFIPKKQPLDLINAAQLLLRSHPELKPHLLFVGSGWERKGLKFVLRALSYFGPDKFDIAAGEVPLLEGEDLFQPGFARDGADDRHHAIL